ncbi:MAG: hypothetical protein MZV64_16645 [Ignavibacteriales bacterium]|nr:hypothetical protein [Ignavibacteriales bacterium]
MMARLALAPILFAPASIIVNASSRVRIPPEAFTPIPGPTAFSHERDVPGRCTASAESRRGLDKISPRPLRDAAGADLLFLGEEAGFEDHLHDSAAWNGRHRRRREHPARLRWRRPRRRPMLITMSISAAPSSIACAASNAFACVEPAPSGNPIVAQTFVAEPARSDAARGT